MNIPFLIGAIIATALLTAFFHWISRAWPLSYGKVVAVNVNSLIIAIFVAAAGMADGGPPNFGASLYYVLAQLIVLIVDLVRTRGLVAKKK